MKRTLTFEYWLDEGWYVGKLKDVPGMFCQAETLKELKENVENICKMFMEEAVEI